MSQAIAELRGAHGHGVVYAARLHLDDLMRAKYRKQMGLMIEGGVPADRLVAKALLPTAFKEHAGYDVRRMQFVCDGPLPVITRQIERLRAEMKLPDEVISAVIATAMRRAVIGTGSDSGCN